MSEPDPEVLDELGEDAIVAAQTTAHQPQRRVQVQVEARSVVVAEPVAAAGRQLDTYDGRSDISTAAGRNKRRRADQIEDAPLIRKRTNWGSVVVWAVAIIVAFAAGGMISVIRHDSGDAAGSTSAAKAAPSNLVLPDLPPPEPVHGAATNEPAAVDLAELPVEHRAAGGAPRKAPVAPAKSGAPPEKPSAPPKTGAIPEGI